MERRRQLALIACAVGLAAILVGLALRNVDFLRAALNVGYARVELWAMVVSTAGSGLVALGAYLGKSRYRLLTYLALIVAVVDATGIRELLTYELVIVVHEATAPMSLAGALVVLFGFVRRSPAAPGCVADQGTRPTSGWWPVLATSCIFAALGWTSVVFPNRFWVPTSLISIVLSVIAVVWSLYDLTRRRLSRERTPLRVYAVTWLLGVATVIADVSLWSVILNMIFS